MIFIIRVGICSNDSELADWLSLECLACGTEVKCFSAPSRDIELCDIVFWDTNLSAALPYGEYFLVGISRESGIVKETYDKILSYPFLLEEVRDIIFNLCGNGVVQNHNKINKISRYTIYLNEKKRQAELFNIKICLSDYEFRVLKRLCKTPSSAVSREELATLFEKEFEGNMVDVYICHLRKKFESITHEKVIYTVRGEGYLTNYCVKEWK